jgi:acetylornithine deacetylase/succinyl-diaminopimelate desuccinylase-like protein
VEALFGESGYTPVERARARPTLEVNGIWGGFQGEGVKTVLPSEAHAKITCRLVPNQMPERIVELLQEHVRRNTTPGVAVTSTPIGSRALPYYVAPDFWGNVAVANALRDVYGKNPFYMRLGGSVPVCEIFLTHLGASTVSLGFALEDEGAHSPNEFLRLASFERGQRAWALALQRLGER